MSFGDAVTSVLNQYATFGGRARRSEYWWFFLFQFLVMMAAGILDAALGFGEGGVVGLLAGLVLFLPALAVTVRRLHDSDRSGWWALVALVPFVGIIVLLVFLLSDSTRGPNRFGPSPKYDQPPSAPGYAQGFYPPHPEGGYPPPHQQP